MAKRESLRTIAGVVFVIAVLITLFSAYIALVYHGDIDWGASWVIDLEFGVWIAGFVMVLAALLFILILLLIPSPSPTSVDFATEGSQPAARDLTVTCANCRQTYIVSDTGDRPLYHACPYCGHTDVITSPEEVPIEIAQPEFQPSPAGAAAPGLGEPELVVRCGNCATTFVVPYSEQRPLYALCTGCGRRGVLREPAPPLGSLGGGPSPQAAPG